jgi:large repetitive protein
LFSPFAGPSDAWLSWTAPLDNGLPVLEYEVLVSTGFALNTTNASVLVGSLTFTTVYTFRLRSRNLVGWSDWSVSLSFTTSADVPLPPYNVTSTLTLHTSADIVWAVPNSRGAPVVGYQAAITNGTGSVLQSLPSTGKSVSVRGLSAGLCFGVVVRAENSQGWGEFSDSFELCTLGK